MLEKYFSAPKTLRRLRGGISGPYVDAFADDLNRDGYAWASAVRYIRAAHISAASFNEGAAFWRTSISTYLILLAAILGGAAVLTSGGARSAITLTSE